MGKIIKLTEGDLIHLIKRVLAEEKINEGSGIRMGMSPEAMQDLKAFHNMEEEVVESEMTEACWKGYTQKGMKTMFGKRYPNCVKKESVEEDLDENETLYEDAYGSVQSINYETEFINEAEYQGRKVQLGKVMQGDVKKSKVYVKNDKGKVVKVNFGFGGTSAKGKRMSIKKNDPARRKSFRARHNCDNPGPRWKPRYWSCRAW